ncbi:disulfide bond formation protein DsbB [Halobacillus dabanensis]|uniref:Probable disulfide formation protein n=1 Tax=Halobacillus dabanensis TaxID=240302 RepID=A0A1I3T284_HALDA|nr:disulfide oxidoreductase [Halobacillus dabanensis]SFJ63951.1 disulfide bond formation protein DsbB [Halobacillus dabanensis]
MKKNFETWLFLLWATSLVATVGSLFFSEVLGYEPCELCWYQRILMYPLVIIYGAALWKKKMDMAIPGLIMSGIGMLISIYHYSLQKIPALSTGDTCGLVPCNAQYINIFGFVTIPFLAGTAFIIIFIIHVMLIGKKGSKGI